MQTALVNGSPKTREDYQNGLDLCDSDRKPDKLSCVSCGEVAYFRPKTGKNGGDFGHAPIKDSTQADKGNDASCPMRAVGSKYDFLKKSDDPNPNEIKADFFEAHFFEKAIKFWGMTVADSRLPFSKALPVKDDLTAQSVFRLLAIANELDLWNKLDVTAEKVAVISALFYGYKLLGPEGQFVEKRKLEWKYPSSSIVESRFDKDRGWITVDGSNHKVSVVPFLFHAGSISHAHVIGFEAVVARSRSAKVMHKGIVAPINKLLSICKKKFAAHLEDEHRESSVAAKSGGPIDGYNG